MEMTPYIQFDTEQLRVRRASLVVTYVCTFHVTFPTPFKPVPGQPVRTQTAAVVVRRQLWLLASAAVNLDE